MSRFLIYIFVIISSLLFFYCTTIANQEEPDPGIEPIPPFELIRSNFYQASHVILFRLDSLKIKDRIYADDGNLGYIVFEFFGEIKYNYKGDQKTNQQINYRLWAEYDSNWEKNWGAKDEFFVFLNREKETGEFHVLEAGQFKKTSGLEKVMKKIQTEERIKKSTNQNKSFIKQI